MPPRMNPLSFLPRRLQIVAVLTTIVVLAILFLGNQQTSDSLDPYLDNVPYGPQLQDSVHHVVESAQNVVGHMPNPLAAPAHTPPPDQANSSSGDARWYSDWKWRNPFSSSVTLDHDRAVLPPLNNRPPIYTYYDASRRRKDEQSRRAEQHLLLIWRRAWWAMGFKPIVLSKSEAMNNPLFKHIQHVKLERALETELMRWLAWGNMGTGILSNFLALPMAPYDDPMLSFWRQGEFPSLTRYEGLGNGLFIGSKGDIETALRMAVSSPALKRVKFIEEALSHDTISVATQPSCIAYYSETAIDTKYPPIKEKLDQPETVGEGLAMLPALINSHLHQTWQTQFPKGIAVLKPLPEHTTSVIEPSLDIAMNLTACPSTPLPSSCPPNHVKCKPCVSNQLKISTPKIYRNDSSIFTIGTMPHPYTVQSLLKSRGEFDVKTIRRETDRDVWIQAATKELLGNGASSLARLPSFKDAVASNHASARSLWLNAEQPFTKEKDADPIDLDWIFGFQLPRQPLPSGKSEPPVPSLERRPEPDYGSGPRPSESELETEKMLLGKAKRFLERSGRRGDRAAVQTRESMEAWNLADLEAWKFIRAYNARRRMERRQWEDEESSFLGKGVFDRLLDKIV